MIAFMLLSASILRFLEMLIWLVSWVELSLCHSDGRLLCSFDQEYSIDLLEPFANQLFSSSE